MEYKEYYTNDERRLITSVGPVGSKCNVEIPNDIVELSKGNFRQCEYIKKIIFPNYLLEINDESFYNCIFLEELNIPKNIRAIGSYAFYNCCHLKKVKFEADIKVLKPYTFTKCRSLEEIEIPEGVEKISNGAFEDCENLRKVIFPSSLRKIEKDIFSFCYNLEEVIINAECKIPKDIFTKTSSNVYEGCNFKVYITEKSFELSPEFVEIYKDNIDFIKPKTLDDLLNEGKSFREINKMYSEKEL